MPAGQLNYVPKHAAVITKTQGHSGETACEHQATVAIVPHQATVWTILLKIAMFASYGLGTKGLESIASFLQNLKSGQIPAHWVHRGTSAS